MRAIEDFNTVISAYREKARSTWLTIKSEATPLKLFAYLNVAAIVFYSLFLRLLGPFSPLVASAPDMYQFYYWNQILKVNKLFDVISGAPYPWGAPVLVYTVNMFARLNTIVLYNTIQITLISFSLFTIYYIMRKFFDGENARSVSFLIAIIIFGIVMPSPLAKYFFGTVFETASPNISHFSFLSFYSGEPKLLDSVNSLNPVIFFHRQTNALPYEVGSAFILPTLYFLNKALVTRRGVFFFIYAECLAIVSAIHPGILLLLFLPSLLIAINVFISCGTDKNTLKRGIVAVSAAIGIGSLWVTQMLVYGVPQAVGAAAPFLDALFKTKRAARVAVEAKAFNAVLIVTYDLSFIILVLSSIALLAYGCFIANREERANHAVIPLFALGTVFVYFTTNLGLPRIVDHTRVENGLALCYALVIAQYYHLFFEKMLFRRFFRARAMLLSSSVVFIVTIPVIVFTPRWIDDESYWKNIIAMELKETPYFIYQIEEKFQPFTYTIVSYVEEFSQVTSMGYHINSHDMLTEYDPLAKALKIPTEFVFIIVENAPVENLGMGQFWYRWRSDIMLKIKDWIALYGQNHTNMKLWAETDQLQIYMIDNRSATAADMEEVNRKRGLKAIER